MAPFGPERLLPRLFFAPFGSTTPSVPYIRYHQYECSSNNNSSTRPDFCRDTQKLYCQHTLHADILLFTRAPRIVEPERCVENRPLCMCKGHIHKRCCVLNGKRLDGGD